LDRLRTLTYSQKQETKNMYQKIKHERGN